MTTRPCFSSSLPCTKRPLESSFMLAFGWKVLFDNGRSLRPSATSFPSWSIWTTPRMPVWCCYWLRSLLLSSSCCVLSRVCLVLQHLQIRVFCLPYIYVNAFFFTSRRVLAIWDTFRVVFAKNTSPKKRQKPHHYPYKIYLLYNFCTNLFLFLFCTCIRNFAAPNHVLTYFFFLTL